MLPAGSFARNAQRLGCAGVAALSARSLSADDDGEKRPSWRSLREQRGFWASSGHSAMCEGNPGKANVLMIGAGEYTTGFVGHAGGAASDKPAGVVAITMIDLRRRGCVDRLGCVDISGILFPQIRANMEKKIQNVYKDMSCNIEWFPEDSVKHDIASVKRAIQSFGKGGMCTIFTPDDTHFQIAMDAIEAGMHVMIAKPAVKNLEHHRKIAEAAKKKGVLVCVEYHKRFDPIYTDARDRIRGFGNFSYYNATMTQHRTQLDTFSRWAGKSSDISYYLNSHHMDIHSWAVSHVAKPKTIMSMSCDGIADKRLARNDGSKCEDTITVMTQWENRDGSKGTALYTASWAAPKADCHTQQYFHYMGHEGEIRACQDHRGYNQGVEGAGYATLNPLYMKYTPDALGYFSGQTGYGYRSLETFVNACREINGGTQKISDYENGQLALINTKACFYDTVMLEAGRRSLDLGRPIEILYEDPHDPLLPTGYK